MSDASAYTHVISCSKYSIWSLCRIESTDGQVSCAMRRSIAAWHIYQSCSLQSLSIANVPTYIQVQLYLKSFPYSILDCLIIGLVIAEREVGLVVDFWIGQGVIWDFFNL